MSISFLPRLAKSPRPSALTDPHRIDELVVLWAAGLVAGWAIRRDAQIVSTVFLTLTQTGHETLSALNPSVQRAG